MNLEKKVESLDKVLKLQKKGVYIMKEKILGEVYLEAADAGYSAMSMSDGTIVFHRQTETIVEDPESPFKGMYADQVPPEGSAYGSGLHTNC